MGAWGIGIFEDDGACDYAGDVVETKDASILGRTLDRVLAIGSGYLEAPDGQEALAAADIVARMIGQPRTKSAYTDKIDEWVQRIKISPDKGLIAKAHRAVVRVLSGPSELLELWQESEEFESWKQVVIALSEQLKK